MFVWMDILCINQHPAKMRKELPRLKEVICRCKFTLLFLDPAADVLMRMWCLYEVREESIEMSDGVWVSVWVWRFAYQGYSFAPIGSSGSIQYL